MRYVFFTNTPAQVHVFKHVVSRLRDEGHEVLVLARDHGCTLALLDWHDLPYRVYGKCGPSKFSLFGRLPAHYARMLRITRRFDPDVVFGHGAYAAHSGLATGAMTTLVTDSEPETIDMTVSRPFADVILTPNTYRKDLGPKHHVFEGFSECAYLHPEVFSPRADVRDRLGVGEDPYVLLRFNAFGSHHDVGKAGFSADQRRTLIERLAEEAVVFVSAEDDSLDLSELPARPYDAHPGLLHDVLAEAELLVADTQTMVTEAALLGTPAIRSNSFVGDDDMGNFLALERNDLCYNLAEFDAVLDRADELLHTEGVKATWQARRDAFLEDTANLTELLVEFARSLSVGHVDGLSLRAETRTPV